MSGSLDNNPPVVVSPDDYIFAVIVKRDDVYACYRSSKSAISFQGMADRLRDIADQIEAAQ